jgi:hypothetical protein
MHTLELAAWQYHVSSWSSARNENQANMKQNKHHKMATNNGRHSDINCMSGVAIAIFDLLRRALRKGNTVLLRRCKKQ